MEVSDQSQSDGGEVEGAGDLVQEAYIYLTERRYPPGCADSRKRSIRKKAGKFVVHQMEKCSSRILEEHFSIHDMECAHLIPVDRY